MWIYIPSDAQLSPPSFGIFKSVFWYGKFVFILVLSLRSVRQKWRRAILRVTDKQKRCSHAGTVFNSCDPFTYYDWTLAPCGFLRLSVFLSDALNYFLPISSHVCERIARVENCPSTRAPFPWIGRTYHGASSFLTNRSRRQNWNKNKFSLSTYTFEYTKRWEAQLCIGGTDSII